LFDLGTTPWCPIQLRWTKPSALPLCHPSIKRIRRVVLIPMIFNTNRDHWDALRPAQIVRPGNDPWSPIQLRRTRPSTSLSGLASANPDRPESLKTIVILWDERKSWGTNRLRLVGKPTAPGRLWPFGPRGPGG